MVNIQVWSVEDWFARGRLCTVPLPPLVGRDEPLLDLLRPQDWQVGLNLPPGE